MARYRRRRGEGFHTDYRYKGRNKATKRTFKSILPSSLPSYFFVRLLLGCGGLIAVIGNGNDLCLPVVLLLQTRRPNGEDGCPYPAAAENFWFCNDIMLGSN